jgi:site-specific DNA-methyltransferase (adenine-specific)
MKKIEDNTVDLLFCDLPWAATSCKWDCALDLPLFWKQVNRVCKINCPMFFCCNAKFGNTLINSNPKNFRYDLVWIKSSPVGFLNAKKMPMKKHELIYVFYRKLPMYDLSSHKHKFLGEQTEDKEYCKYDINKNCYGGGKEDRIKISKKKEDHSIKYDPPLPTSIIKDDLFIRGKENNSENKDVYNYNERLKNGTLYHHARKLQKGDEPIYDPPLPNSILEIKSEKGKHATQKPVQLIEWILKYYSKVGDTVLDPTMGSGSSGVACINMKRKYIGIEKDPDIFKIAKSRVLC